MVTTMAAVSLTQQQYQQFIDRISGLEARMATLQTHADAQQEQIRMTEVVIQQLRANPHSDGIHQVTGRSGSQGNYWLATPGT